MKRLLIVCMIAVAIYACGKETDAVYDSHLFADLQAQSWIFDYATIRDSLHGDSTIHPADTVMQVVQFNAQQYVTRTIRISDSALIDTAAYQIIYDNPSRIYFYDATDQKIKKDFYLNIDTVNASSLVLTKTDTFNTVTRSYYHAQ